MAYLFAGVTLLFKRVGSFFQIINFGFLGLFWQNRGELAEGSFGAFLYDAFPLTLGMKNLQLLFEPETASRLGAVFQIYFNQALFSIAFAAIGYLAFAAMERKARSMALLSQY